MQAITPVDVHVGNERRKESNVKKNTQTSIRRGRQMPRMHTRVMNKAKTTKTKPILSPSSHIPKRAVIPKLIVPANSRSSSSNREPWVPAPGRSTKGQKVSWQNTTSRLEINPVTEILLDDEDSWNTEHDKHNTTINSQKSKILRSKSLSPIRNSNRSSSLDEQRRRRSTTPKVSFHDDSIIERQRTRSTTPIQGPIHLSSDREQLLITLADSEADIAQITKKLSSLTEILRKFKLDDQTVSFDVEQLYQQRNELLHSIEQFGRSNSKLKKFLQHQYHLEAEHGIIYDKYYTLETHLHEIANENKKIRRLLSDRENDNIALQTELEHIKTQTVGFDTMKTSLEHNRAHLQRELYSKEGEIHRLQCALRSLERDLQRSHCQCGNFHRSMKYKPRYSISSCSSSSNITNKPKAITIERLQNELNDRDHEINQLKRKLHDNNNTTTNEQKDDTNSEILRLKTKLEETEQLVNEYRAQLQTQTFKASANHSKNHLSEIELEKIRNRLQKRIEELEPLPELLKQAEVEREKLQKDIDELRKYLPQQSNFLTDQVKSNRFSSNDDIRTLQRQIISLEEENEKLIKMLNAKEEELRNAQHRLNAKTYELPSMNKQNDLKKPDFRFQDDTYGSNERFLSKDAFNLEQQISRLRREYSQLKQEKDELERRFATQLAELRDKLEQSNNRNRTMQSYINSIKTAYTTLFNDTLPTSFTRYTTT
ncbi:unnamed protein product [Rotaria sordida]|uniref:Uncharacterized protein n=1 Tax=Rotaria sordida TaxID=392033 RepID=A0A814V770_9BILA|nr:unnamed protein product [Rotaria sordida]CAF1450028.1 unnamed protein product [Rotaria sordida]